MHISDNVKHVFYVLCDDVATPYATKASMLLNSSDAEFLAQLEAPVPLHYLSATDFFKDYVVYNYLRKYVGLDSGSDKAAKALSKFADAEERCKLFNNILKSHTPNGDVDAVFLLAQRKIGRLLGAFELKKVLRGCGMGPGASFDKRRNAPPGSKFTLPISVTPSALPYCKVWLELDIHWFSSETGILPDGPYSPLQNCFTVVRGNKLTTVPKDALVDRVICIEPTFNLFLQKGVGSYIRDRLKAFGVDLDDQTRNQEYAKGAYEHGYATIDLSSASDTISRELVKNLLPLDWYNYLDGIRSKEVRHSNGWHINEKFSSMGNGFTFELESLIFWALLPECEVSTVYGDDIICNQSVALEAIKSLEVAGFIVNKAKSFIDGPFYESCGKHYFHGIDVTPIYQKESISTSSTCVRAFNRMFRLVDRAFYESPLMRGNYFIRALSTCRSFYPYKGREPIVPHTADDRGFLTYDLSSFQYDPNRGYKCHVLKELASKVHAIHDGLYVRKLLSPYSAVDFDHQGRVSHVYGGSKVRISTAWIQTYPLRNVWTPSVYIRPTWTVDNDGVVVD